MAKEYIEPTKELIIPIYKEEKERETKFLDGRFHPFSWGLPKTSNTFISILPLFLSLTVYTIFPKKAIIK